MSAEAIAEIGVYKVSSTATEPIKGTRDSACFDVCADLLGPQSNGGVSIYTRRNDKEAMTYKTSQKIQFIPQDGVVLVHPGDRALIPTGLVFDIPSGYCIKMYPRSGTSLKQGLTLVNAVGIIDSDYTEETYIPVINLSDKTQFVKHGDRLAQIELSRVEPAEFNFLTKAPRQKTDRTGGFGSTGV